MARTATAPFAHKLFRGVCLLLLLVAGTLYAKQYTSDCPEGFASSWAVKTSAIAGVALSLFGIFGLLHLLTDDMSSLTNLFKTTTPGEKPLAQCMLSALVIIIVFGYMASLGTKCKNDTAMTTTVKAAEGIAIAGGVIVALAVIGHIVLSPNNGGGAWHLCNYIVSVCDVSGRVVMY